MTTLDVDQPLPGMPDTLAPELWAVHVRGSDDLIAAANRVEADKLKSLLDDLDRANAERGNVPMASAEVLPWPGSAEGHAQALLNED